MVVVLLLMGMCYDLLRISNVMSNVKEVVFNDNKLRSVDTPRVPISYNIICN